MAVHGGSFVFGFDQLAAIACATESMVTAAGGTPKGGNFASPFGLLAAIDCNICETVVALGGSGCTPGYDGDLGLLMSIACNTRNLVDASGGTQAGPNGYVYEALSLWAQIACNLRQVAIKTGTPAPTGGGFDGIPNLMEAVYCYLQDIVENGFAPPDPVQTFIDALLPFSPQILIIADKFVGNNGDPVTSAPDSSGNNNPMAQSDATHQPSFTTAGPNGKKAYQFHGTTRTEVLQCPLPGLTKMCSIVVYNTVPLSNAGSTRIATLQTGNSGSDATAGTPISQFCNNGVGTESYLNGPTFGLNATEGQWHSNAAWFSGANGKMLDEGGNTNSAAASETALPGAWAAIGGVGVTAGYTGKIAFHARWATAPSDSDVAAFLAIVNNYYGL